MLHRTTGVAIEDVGEFERRISDHNHLAVDHNVLDVEASQHVAGVVVAIDVDEGVALDIDVNVTTAVLARADQVGGPHVDATAEHQVARRCARRGRSGNGLGSGILTPSSGCFSSNCIGSSQ